MKHIPTFESFNANPLNEWKKAKLDDLYHDMKVKIVRGRYAGATGVLHDYDEDPKEGKEIQLDVLVDQPGKPFSHLSIDDILIENALK